MMIPYEKEYLPPPKNGISWVGQKLLFFILHFGRGLHIIIQAFLFCTLAPRYQPEISRQLLLCGFRSFPLTAFVALFTGMILALQSGLELAKFGQADVIGSVVTTSMCREMGPLMTAFIMAASVGSAFTAEIGTMSVSEEIAALQSMAVHPVRLLVMPRLLAMLLMSPVLTVFTSLIGSAGGCFIGYSQLGVQPQDYYSFALKFLVTKDLSIGLLKAIVFAIIIVGISCYQGFSVTNGAVGVGQATRRTVTYSFLSILVAGYVLTRIFY